MKNFYSKLFSFFCIVLATSSVITPARAQLLPGVRKVVIDAGHGGTDPGAVSIKYNLKEKDIVLSTALALGELIKKNHPDVEVIYTRKTDVLIPLATRGKMANDAGADLFISIHINAARSVSASGTETIVMGADDAGRNLDITMRENNVITYEEDYTTNYMGFDPNSAESYIMFSLMQYAYQSQSLMFADMIQKHFTKTTKMPSRGVKQAPILVLWRTAMPAVLAEFGFISNDNEAKFISSKEGIQTYATCLFNAFSEYKARVENSGKMIVVESVPASSGTTFVMNNSETAAAPGSPATAAGKVVYRIQICSSTKKIAKNSTEFGPYRGEVKEMIIDSKYKYFTKECTSYREVVSLLPEVKKNIKDAFVVSFLDDSPITIDQARRITNEL